MGSFQMRSSTAVAVVLISMILLHHCEAYITRSSRDPAIVSPGQCSAEDVAVYQNNASHPSSEIPAYSVDIINNCDSCTVRDVHISCGEFASTELVDPTVFRRLADGDCLVKDGGAIGPGEVVNFEYANFSPYPLAVESVACN